MFSCNVPVLKFLLKPSDGDLNKQLDKPISDYLKTLPQTLLEDSLPQSPKLICRNSRKLNNGYSSKSIYGINIIKKFNIDSKLIKYLDFYKDLLEKSDDYTELLNNLKNAHFNNPIYIYLMPEDIYSNKDMSISTFNVEKATSSGIFLNNIAGTLRHELLKLISKL